MKSWVVARSVLNDVVLVRDPENVAAKQMLAEIERAKHEAAAH